MMDKDQVVSLDKELGSRINESLEADETDNGVVETKTEVNGLDVEL